MVPATFWNKDAHPSKIKMNLALSIELIYGIVRIIVNEVSNQTSILMTLAAVVMPNSSASDEASDCSKDRWSMEDTSSDVCAKEGPEESASMLGCVTSDVLVIFEDRGSLAGLGTT